MHRYAIAGLALAAVLPPWSTQAQITNPARYLAQMRCPNGKLEVATPACRNAAPQKAGDFMRMRRHDWPGPDGYQIGDGFAAADGKSYVATFSYRPWGPFTAANGDGGEVYVIEGNTVRIAATQDGGQMGVLQSFAGRGCGGTGWVLFRTDARADRWTSVVARLNGAPLGSACSAANAAFTRYRLQNIPIPFLIGGKRIDRVLPTVISEHYDAASIEAAYALERTILAAGVGRVVWESWTKGAPSSQDTAVRCPGTKASTPPAPGWRLSDCRYATNLIEHAEPMTGVRYAWPPKIARLP